ncbi:hypothetical protein DFH07DRAFT_962094 [Mycena maculata]|uniref:Uncharacterized protein n=1 Tax=Mycena maculata TaxID=230809 RepID=A0AAD7ITS3_9AGAR|nr:hypothetical protein DFH07DRAFT_962094 [Mycena maculata]
MASPLSSFTFVIVQAHNSSAFTTFNMPVPTTSAAPNAPGPLNMPAPPAAASAPVATSTTAASGPAVAVPTAVVAPSVPNTRRRRVVAALRNAATAFCDRIRRAF